MSARRPRVLVTGFTPFPGAPLNPTEWLMEALAEEAGLLANICDLHTAVLPVDYRRTMPVLEAAAASVRPVIAIHFGLAHEARGFRLERLARNEIAAGREDNAGHTPAADEIVPELDHVPTALPLDAVAGALAAQGLPVEWSDDAGGYLCNYVFFHSVAGLCAPLAGAASGFVHVPMPGEWLTRAQLLQGAWTIIETCVSEY